MVYILAKSKVITHETQYLHAKEYYPSTVYWLTSMCLKHLKTSTDQYAADKLPKSREKAFIDLK